jgi:hypothetical protein
MSLNKKILASFFSLTSISAFASYAEQNDTNFSLQFLYLDAGTKADRFTVCSRNGCNYSIIGDGQKFVDKLKKGDSICVSYDYGTFYRTSRVDYFFKINSDGNNSIDFISSHMGKPEYPIYKVTEGESYLAHYQNTNGVLPCANWDFTK